MTAAYRYYVVDDSKLDCTIATKIIKAAGVPEDRIGYNLHATEALQELVALTTENHGTTFIVFVDVRMPVMSGFEFIEAFECLPEAVQSACVLFMLSSSINESDMNRARSYRSVADFLNKPLTIATVQRVAEDVRKRIVDDGQITSG